MLNEEKAFPKCLPCPALGQVSEDGNYLSCVCVPGCLFLGRYRCSYYTCKMTFK